MPHAHVHVQTGLQCHRACPVHACTPPCNNPSLHPLQVAFGFGVSMRILGVDIAFNLNLDSGSVPWNAVVNYLKDKLLEPLTGKN